MRIRRIGDLRAAHMLLACGLALAGAGGAEEPPTAVAIVCEVAGAPVVERPGGERETVALFDWLPEGTWVETIPGTRLILALRSGRRYELSESARAAVSGDELRSVSGNVRSLASLPPWPQLTGVLAEENVGRRSGAVRIRGERIPIRSPGEGLATLADRTILEFGRVDGARRYRVEIQDRSGRVVFHVESQALRVPVSPDVLERGASYYWTVSSLDRPGAVARGESTFSTLTAEAERAREALIHGVRETGDAASFALLAAVDRRLGLFDEARESLRSALERSPGDLRLAAALADLEPSVDEARED